jgi:hypothetical protein
MKDWGDGFSMTVSETDPSDTLRLRKRSWDDPIAEYTPKRNAWAGSLSFFSHLILFLLLAWFWQPAIRGTGGSDDRPIGIAMVKPSPAGREYFLVNPQSSTGSAGENDNRSDSEKALSDGGAMAAALDVSELLQGLQSEGTSDATGDMNQKSGSLGLGEINADIGNPGSIPKATTTVFGVTGSGTRFVYVFDRSDSMNGYQGLPLATAKRELIQSLQTLDKVHQFQIVFYNDAPTPFKAVTDTTPKMLFGDQPSKQDAESFVRAMFATGGTEHAAALRMGLSMGPDVIFFLTDAADPPLKNSQLQQIVDRAVKNGTTIHCIEFGAGPSAGDGGWIRELAEETTGKYRYVDVQSFSGDKP